MRAWTDLLKRLESTLGTESVEKWLRPIQVVDFNARNLYLFAPDDFTIQWFDEHVKRDALKPLKIHFKKPERAPPKQEEKPTIGSSPLDPSSTFDTFLSTDDSKLTVDYMKNLKPGALSPLYLHGPASSGKTHLLMATAHTLTQQGHSVFYVHAETFTEHLVKGIRASEMQPFRDAYRSPDILIIDDIHTFARRSATQEEFFHTFNALHAAGKQIILASHLPPAKLTDIEPRLVSRFEWGLVLPLAPPPLKQVLLSRAATHNFPLTEDVLSYLIDTFKNPMIPLEALFLRHTANIPLTLENAQAHLKDLLQNESKQKITPETITSEVAAYFGLCSDDLLGKSQSKDVSTPRKIAMTLCRKKLKMPYAAIGRYFGRDHSTVMSSIRQIETTKSDEIKHDTENLLVSSASP